MACRAPINNLWSTDQTMLSFFSSTAATQNPRKRQNTQQYYPNTKNYLGKLQLLPWAQSKIAKQAEVLSYVPSPTS